MSLAANPLYALFAKAHGKAVDEIARCCRERLEGFHPGFYPLWNDAKIREWLKTIPHEDFHLIPRADVRSPLGVRGGMDRYLAWLSQHVNGERA